MHGSMQINVPSVAQMTMSQIHTIVNSNDYVEETYTLPLTVTIYSSIVNHSSAGGPKWPIISVKNNYTYENVLFLMKIV